jgi:hypothetical protein
MFISHGLITCIPCTHSPYPCTPPLSPSPSLNSLGHSFCSLCPPYGRNSLCCSCISPNGKYISVATDKDRLIIYARSTGTLVKNLYGANNDGFSNPRHCWHPSGASCVLATVLLACVVVWYWQPCSCIRVQEVTITPRVVARRRLPQLPLLFLFVPLSD